MHRVTRFFQVPEGIDRGEYRFYEFTLNLYLIAFFAFILFLPFYILMGTSLLIISNILSIIVTGISFLLIRRKQVGVFLLPFIIVSTINISLTIYYFGLLSYAGLYYLLVLTLIFISEWKFKFMAMAGGILILVASLNAYYVFVNGPVIQLSQNQLVLFNITNLIFSFLALGYAIYFFSTKARSAETKLMETNDVKDKFFYLIAHDLKNPISGIHRMAEFVVDYKDNNDKETEERILNEIKQSSGNLYNLLENLLEWARNQQGEITFNPGEVELEKVINQNMMLFKMIAELKNIHIKYENDCNEVIVADEKMVSTVMRNLISNAIKFTKKDGEIYIFCKKIKNAIQVNVQDTGIGINPEEQEQVFKLQKRFTRPGTDGEKGSGFGLILCKDFIEKNGGSIWLSSTPNKGSTFHFTLPLT